jgi:hypothetical protein
MHKQTSDKTPSKKTSKITQRFDKPAASRGTASPSGRDEGQAASRGTASPSGRDEGQKNEGEGSYTATRKYDAGVRDFVESGAVEPAAREAEQALDGAERAELTEAETLGKRGGTDVERGSNTSRGRT